MRNFEEDFEFDFDDDIGIVKPQGIRKDSYRTVTHDPNRDKDVEHRRRIDAHTERIQRELGVN